MAYITESGAFNFEKYGSEHNIHFNFESGEFNCNKEKVFRATCVVLAALAIMVSVGIL